MHNLTVIYTTLSSLQDAENLAEKAIIEKLAACVNILPSCLSIYIWEDKLEKSSEYMLIFKTSLEKSEILYGWLLENHPYDVPAILKGNVSTSPEFFSYILEQTEHSLRRR